MEWTGRGLRRSTNCFLVRDPRAMVASLHARTPNPSIDDTGLPQQRALFDEVHERTGRVPPVLDAHDVLSDPSGGSRSILPGSRLGLRRMRCCHGRPGPRSTAMGPGRHGGTIPSRHRPEFKPEIADEGPELPAELEPIVANLRRALRASAPTPAVGHGGTDDHAAVFDERNRDLLININGELLHRDEAGHQSLRFGGAGRRCGLGRTAGLRRTDLPAQGASRIALRRSAEASLVRDHSR